MTKIQYRKADVDGFDVFYREAGRTDALALLLLHGFPSSGHMFRELIPALSDRFHIVAPDLPGFGQSDMPSRDKFAYTFAGLAEVIERFTEVIGLTRFAIYVFDYGAPTGFRIAVRHPERISAIVSQNGNAYEEGLSEGWNPPRLLAKSIGGEPCGPSGLSFAGDDDLAVHPRCRRCFPGLSGRVFARQLLSGTSRRR
jgi:pimeloyl-ACP methyl ester carboxylesterase